MLASAVGRRGVVAGGSMLLASPFIVNLTERDKEKKFCRYEYSNEQNSHLDKMLFFAEKHLDHPLDVRFMGMFNGKPDWMFNDTQKHTFKFENYDFSVRVVEPEQSHIIGDGYNTITDRKLIIYTHAPREIVDKFTNDAIKYYDETHTRGDQTFISYEVYNAKHDFWKFFGRVEPREMNSVYLPQTVIDDIVKQMDDFRDAEKIKRIKQLHLTHKKVYLFEGVWGSGKSTLIRALATKYNANIYVIPITKDLDDKTLLDAISGIPRNSLLVFEDIDSLIDGRNTGTGLTFSGLINALDGVGTKDNLEVILTTNHRDKIDPAMLRPGRIDHVITFGYANEEQIVKMYMNFTKGNSKQGKEMYQKLRKKFKKRNGNFTIAEAQQYLREYIDEPEKALQFV